MNLVIITSVINISKTPLSYSETRSIYSVEERFLQTIKTIDSVRQRIPNCKIMLVESTDITDEYKKIIQEKVDYFEILLGEVREAVNSPYKCIGESTQILESLKRIDLQEFTNIFKISGRYFLNDNFIYDKFNNDKNMFFETEDKLKLATVFYKISNKELYLETLNYCKENTGMLEVYFKNFFAKDFYRVEVLGIEGNVSHDGCYINW